MTMEKLIFGSVALLVLLAGLWVFSVALNTWEVSSYEAHAERVASTAGWQFLGCDRAVVLGIPTRSVCLVKDSDGKIVDIDNIRSD
jgi:hypothetical protein